MRGVSTSRSPTIDARIVADQAYLPALVEILDGALERVDVLAYSFSIGSPKKAAASAPWLVANKLVDAVARGAYVRVYIEGRRETAARNAPTARLLERGGVRVVHGSTHAKGVCVDGRVLFGSTNLTQQSLTKNIETNLLFDDARVTAGFEKYFEHLWHGGRHGGVALDPPMLADGDFLPALLEMIEGAKTRIDFSMYFFHVSAIEHALVRAQRRGVHVRGLLHDHTSFAMSYVRRTRGTAQRLRAGGIGDLHYGPATLFTHSKFLVRDDAEVFLGTGNWLHEDVKVHPQLHVRFTNAKLARALAQHLAATIAARGTPVAG